MAIKIISTAEAPVEFSRKFLPREISSLNATYKHLNVVGRDPRQPGPSHLPQAAPSLPGTLMLEPAPSQDPSPMHPGGPWLGVTAGGWGPAGAAV